jgi:exosortase O
MPRLLLNLTTILLVLAAHTSGLWWLVTRLAVGDATPHLIVLAGGLAALAFTARTPTLTRLSAPPSHNPWALAVLLLATAASVALRPLDLGIAEGITALLALWGLAGLWLSPQRWWAGRLGLAFALLVLPSLTYLDQVLGFPLRELTAAGVSASLAALDVAHIGSGTILQLDGSAAYVDLPCAGIRSLWTGAVFLLAATWLRRRAAGGRWLLVAMGYVGLLVLFNGLRVLALVGVVNLGGWELAGQILHAPLGVLGFAAASAAAWFALGWLPENEEAWNPSPPTPLPQGEGSSENGSPLSPGERVPEGRVRGPRWTTPLVAATALAAVLVGHPDPAAPPLVDLPTPPGMAALEVSEKEARLLGEHGGRIVKARFEQDGLTGSLVLVESASWRAHHVPEVCLRAAGLEVGETSVGRISGGRVRFAEAQHQEQTATALWWLQSADTLTDDHTERIWRGLRDRERWTMVSVLVDGAPGHDDPRIQALVEQLREFVGTQLRSST